MHNDASILFKYQSCIWHKYVEAAWVLPPKVVGGFSQVDRIGPKNVKNKTKQNLFLWKNRPDLHTYSVE